MIVNNIDSLFSPLFGIIKSLLKISDRNLDRVHTLVAGRRIATLKSRLAPISAVERCLREIHQVDIVVEKRKYYSFPTSNFHDFSLQSNRLQASSSDYPVSREQFSSSPYVQ